MPLNNLRDENSVYFQFHSAFFRVCAAVDVSTRRSLWDAAACLIRASWPERRKPPIPGTSTAVNCNFSILLGKGEKK